GRRRSWCRRRRFRAGPGPNAVSPGRNRSAGRAQLGPLLPVRPQPRTAGDRKHGLGGPPMSRSRRVRRPARRAALLALALAPRAAGCASLGGESEFVFEYSQKKYTQYIRWSQFDRAEKFVAPESSAAFQQLKASLRDVRFTDY